MKVVQLYSSKDTSINRVSKIYKKIKFSDGLVVLDWGCGKYNTSKEYVLSQNSTVTFLGYDPYNREDSENLEVLNYLKYKKADIIVCANVLNVIYEDSVIYNILFNLSNYSKTGSHIYIQIYEGDKSGIGRKTSRGYQRNMRTKDYIEFINHVFASDEVKVRSNVIEVVRC